MRTIFSKANFNDNKMGTITRGNVSSSEADNQGQGKLEQNQNERVREKGEGEEEASSQYETDRREIKNA